MKKLLLLAALATALIAPARADYLIKDGAAIPETIKAGDLGVGSLGGREILPYSSPADSTGAPYSLTNPLAVQFGTGITLPSFAAPQHFICDSGCAGGGGGAVNLTQILGAAPSATNPLWVSPATGATFPVSGSVSLTGTLPAFAATPTVNIGTAPSIAVTGTFWQATQPVSAAALPLPTGAATQTTLASVLTALGSPFQAGASIGNTSFGISGTLPAYAATPTFNLGTIGTAATAANQTTGNSSLSSIDTKTPALGQALAAASVPVVLTAAQITTLTPLSSVTVTQGTGTNLHMVCDSGCSSSSSPTFGAAFPATGTPVGMSQGGLLTALTGTSGNLNVQCANCSGSGVSTADAATFTAGSSLFAGGGGFFQTTATSNPLTTGQQGMFQVTANRALFTNLRNASGTEIGVAATPIQVSLANTGANATAVKVDGSAVTQPVSGTVAFSNSTIAVTNAGTFAVQLSGATNNINNISGTVSLPTGAATAALQPTNAAIASTTAGQTGHLMMGAATTAAPSYTTAQSNPLSLTLAGALRVDGSAVTQPVSLTSTTITGTVAVTQSGAWSLSANQSVNVAQINGITPLMGNGVTGTGSQRVTIASDNTPFAIKIDQTTPGTTNLVSIGTNGTVNPTTAASWGLLAQSAATSGQLGQLMLGAVTTAAPSYTTANSNPLSLTTAGDLRTVFSNTTLAVTNSGTFAVQSAPSTAAAWGIGATAAAVPANAIYNAVNIAGNLVGLTGLATGATVKAATVAIVDASGTQITSFGGSNASVSATASAVPASATYLGASVAGTLTGLIAKTGASVASSDVGLVVSVANSNSNGQQAMAASSPVVIASDQSAVAVKAASGAIASGAVASGAIASGAVASGAYASGSIGAGAVAAGSYVSGSILSGALASGAVVDITNMSGTTAAAVPAKAVLSGARSGANIVELIQASASAAINVSTATTTQLVALSGSTKIYVTALDVIAAGTGNITFVYGTGASCGTGTTSLTGAYNLTAQAGLAKGGGIGPVLVVPSGNALCVTTTAAVQMSGSVAYTQF